jgi:hypothetical protein
MAMAARRIFVWYEWRQGFEQNRAHLRLGRNWIGQPGLAHWMGSGVLSIAALSHHLINACTHFWGRFNGEPIAQGV